MLRQAEAKEQSETAATDTAGLSAALCSSNDDGCAQSGFKADAHALAEARHEAMQRGAAREELYCYTFSRSTEYGRGCLP